MTIILFLVDTSSSMCQKAYVNGVQKTYLDIAKGAVETFLKYRQRTQDCLGDRYMLLTFEEPPANVKAGWKENHATFMNELKNLQSHGLTSMGESLRNAFDLLNLNRMQSGIDTYGQGRCPFYLEPSVIIVITDGGRYSYRNGVHQEIILPLSNQIPGTKFTKEPFRWDQRLFSLVLRMPGNKIDERVEGKVPHDDSPIERMCEVTGGRSYRVRSHYVLNQCIESLVQKVQPGVVLQFEPLLPKEGSGAPSAAPSVSAGSSSGSGSSSGPVSVVSAGGGSSSSGPSEPPPDIVFQPVKKMIYVQKHITQKTFPIGYWPLPEPYWPDSKAITLPPRDAHPKLKILTPAVEEPQLVRSFPVDKYEIEGCPLTLQILNKREMNKCWQVIVTNGMHGFELPFGYLKAAPNFTQVHLYVLAYNYPALLPLLHDLIHKYNMSPPNDLMYKFNAYVRSIPPYYCPFLRKALVNINVPYQLLQFLLPENVDNYLSPTIANQLKHIKNTAKQDQENLCLKVYKQLKQPKPPYRQVETAKLCTGAALRRDLVRHPLLRDTFAKLHAEIEPVENYTIVVPQLTHQTSAKTYRNPFDIPRRDLVEEIARMRETFLRPATLVAKDSGHCLPIAEMGNYQEYLKNKDNPLREIEPTNVRQHMFGNPYKKDKHMVMVDEADLSDVAPMKSPNGNGPGGGPPGSPSGSGSPTGGGPSSQGPQGSGGGGGPGMPGGMGSGMSGLMMGAGGSGNSSKKLDSTGRGRKRKAGPLPRSFKFRRLSTDSRSSCSSSGSSSTTKSELGSAGGGSGSDSSASSALGGEISSSSASSNASSLAFDEDSNSSFVSSCSEASSDSGMSLTHSDRLAFDFSEEEAGNEDTPLNGHVHNFINGISDDALGTADTEAGGGGQGAVPGAAGPAGASSVITSATAASASAASTSSTPSSEPVSVIMGAPPAVSALPASLSSASASALALASLSSSSLASSSPAIPASNGGEACSGSASSSGSPGSSSSASASHSSISSLSSLGGSSSSSSSGVLYVPQNGLTTHAAYSSNLSSPLDSLTHLGAAGAGGVGGGVGLVGLAGLAGLAGLGSSHKPGSLPLANGYGHSHSSVLSPPSPLALVAPNPLGMSGMSLTGSATSGAAASAAGGSASGSSSTSSSSSAYYSHNDINDASEISRILQTCHNGTSNSNSSSSSSSGGSSSAGSGGGSGVGGALGTSNLNGNGSSDAVGAAAGAGTAENDHPLGFGAANSFDALKRAAGAANPAGNPHYYWASGLNHHQNNNNNSSGGAVPGGGGGGAAAATTAGAAGAGAGLGATPITTTSNNNSSSNNNNNHGSSSPNKSLEVKGGSSCGSSPTHNINGELNPLALSLALTEEQREAARRHNIDLRLQIFRDIRRPGRDYSQLLEHLNLVKGDHEMQSDFVEMCIGESMRFRRHRMVGSIQEWWDRKQQPTAS